MQEVLQAEALNSQGLLPVEAPTFSDIRDNFAGQIMSCVWMNMDVVKRERIVVPEHWHLVRPSFDEVAGEGASMVMPGSVVWLSHPDNWVHVPKGTDPSFLAAARGLGILHTFLDIPYSQLDKAQQQFGVPLNLCDDFVHNRAIDRGFSEEAFRDLNCKSKLAEFSEYAAPYKVASLNDFTREMYDSFGGESFFVKKNNTEVVGQGVLKITSWEDFERVKNQLKCELNLYQGLCREFILQPEIQGKSKSLQYYHTPEGPVELISISEQFVNDQGVYLGSLNLANKVEDLSVNQRMMMIDMAQRVRKKFPKAYGIMMNDFIETRDGEVWTLDPGLRPSGNTGTALARMFVAEQLNRADLASYTLPLPAKGYKESYENYFQAKDELLDLKSLEKNGFVLMPWGYNPYQGAPVMAMVFPVNESVDEIEAAVRRNF